MGDRKRESGSYQAQDHEAVIAPEGLLEEGDMDADSDPHKGKSRTHGSNDGDDERETLEG